MKTIEKQPVIIEKEDIQNLRFSRREVLTDTKLQEERKYDLYRAQILGNVSHSKVWLTFETSEAQLFKVCTTIWAVGETFVTLKRGISIPIHAIHQID